jgi:hypothetical protein|tara:strand:+ start:374 stop:547 length:174 start_codon:yes stop_codon:yes gene_type:complete
MIKGRLNACASHEQELRPGSGPHKYQLWCKVCNKHSQWVTVSDAFKIAKYSNNKETV